MNHSPLTAALTQAFQYSLEYLQGLDSSPVASSATLPELRASLGRPLNSTPIPASQVIADLVTDSRSGLIGSAGGRFFAWAIGGSVPAALAADWLTSAWDQNAALFACAPAAAVVEEIAGGWLKDLLGLPATASFAFTSGCQMAHVTCLAAARNRILGQHGWNVEQDGLAGAPTIRVLASNPHGSIERAIRFLGIGARNTVSLPLNAGEQTTSEALETALRDAQGLPVIVILQAGDLNTGSFDHYRELIPLARQHQAWVHVDGAFGLWAAASPVYRHLLDGFEKADSWSTDGHKWLNVPYDCGYAFVAHPECHREAMSHRAPYLVHDDDARDQIDWTPEWSRRARGFATYAAIREMGRDGIADLINRCCQLTRELVQELSQVPGVEVIWQPIINQGLIRFVNSARSSDEIIERVNATGEAFFMGTTWRGDRAMRVSVLNWQTSERDIKRAAAAVQQALE